MDFVYVAQHTEYNKPIAASNNWDELKFLLDDYFGSDKKTFHPYDSKYPDEYQGFFRYEIETDGVVEVEEVKVYEVDYK